MRLIHLQKKLLTASKPTFRGFSQLQTLRAEDLNLQITRHFHQKSGAMIYNIISNDSDNTFAPIVKTLPQNDTGCPHILEHLACCGSHQYPIRDPFFNMLRRSVNTYMNAWTGDDFTAYPFSSANGKDFQNLYKVYLDMCLKPLLNQLDFRQQGWRYEFNPETKQKQIKGIVFNEMKGAYQNPDRQLYVQIANRLFATTPYGYDSGGKPQSIVKLSYEQVQNMHKYYYHPSNMSFYYYGNADIKDKLAYLQDQYLIKHNYTNTIKSHQQKSRKLLQNMPQSINQVFHTVISSTAQTPNVAVTYNIGMLDKADNIELICLNILSYLLLQTNQAIFYQEFIEAGLADSFGMSGFSVGSVLTFSLTLKNVTIEHQQVLSRVQKCLQNIIEKGVNENRLEQYIRQTQLDILTPKQTHGIVYLSNCMPYMVNRLPLYNLVNIRSNLAAAVHKLKTKSELKAIITKYFLQNGRKIAIKQQPSKTKSQQSSKNFIGLQLPQDLIKAQQEQLKKRQQSLLQNSSQCLPKLFLKDLTKRIHKQYQIKLYGQNLNNNKYQQIHVGMDIKDINFIRVVFKIDMAKQQNMKLLHFLDIWRYTLKQGIAVSGLTNKQLSSKLNICSNQFNISIEKSSPILQPTCVNIVFSASCLSKNINEYLQLLRKIINQPQFKQQDIQNIFRSYKSEKVQELLDGSVMQYCMDYAASFLGVQSKIFNMYEWVTEGIKISETGKVPQEFKVLHQMLRSQADVTLIQHNKQYKPNLVSQLGFKYRALKTTNKLLKQALIKKQTYSLSQNKQIAVTNSYDVNFCTEQYLGPQFLSKQHAHISLLVQLLEQDYLHQKIREKGGAYGARAVYRDSGAIALYSYMDPYSTQTFNAFQESIGQILSSQINQQRLQQVKIKVIGALEVPIIPQKQCVNLILKRYTNEERNKLLDYIKEADWNQIKQTGKKYLLAKNKSRVMFGKDVPKNFIQQKLKIPKQQDSKPSEQNLKEQ